MMTNQFTNSYCCASKDEMSEDIDEKSLDNHYRMQLCTLDRICRRHKHQTDMAICSKWLKIFGTITKSEKYARNCLMLLLIIQLDKVGHVSKPFTDMRNCAYNLNDVLHAYETQNHNDDERIVNSASDTENNDRQDKRGDYNKECTCSQKSEYGDVGSQGDLKSLYSLSSISLSDNSPTMNWEINRSANERHSTPLVCADCAICRLRDEKSKLIREIETLSKPNRLPVKLSTASSALQQPAIAAVNSVDVRLEKLHQEIFHQTQTKTLKTSPCKSSNRSSQQSPKSNRLFILKTAFAQLNDDPEFDAELEALEYKFEELFDKTFMHGFEWRLKDFNAHIIQLLKRKFEAQQTKVQNTQKTSVLREPQGDVVKKLTELTMLKKVFLDQFTDKIESAEAIVTKIDNEIDIIVAKL